jgi:hypothetical protein
MSNVMKMRFDTGHDLQPVPAVEDLELRDESARSNRHPGWYAAVLVLDALAILAFVAWVVVPRLT